MRILLIGAAGFIGRHVAARLLGAGHAVVAAVRDPARVRRRFPGIEAVAVDLNRMADPADWQALLGGVDSVVNAAGILQSRPGQSAEAIHVRAPIALFEACRAAGIRRVVQISAISADPAAGTEYARTKRRADDHLRGLDLDWVVLRPSLVYAEGSYGGTSLLRGLAGLPFVLPLVGTGDQAFQPIHVEDVAETVLGALTGPGLVRRTLDPVGPERLSLREILVRTRAWLDLPPVPCLAVPLPLVRVASRVADLVAPGPLGSTALAQLDYGNCGDAAAFEAAVGFRPRRLDEAMRARPSHVQDRWHARLYFLRPALTLALVLLWLGSGLAGLWHLDEGSGLARAIGLKVPLDVVAVVGFSLLDLGIAAALVAGRRPAVVGLLQLVLVGGYTLSLGLLDPALWGAPLGPLLKNVPCLAAILAWLALSDET
jgi:uncharacterized protein YbjT (DUF2867 family)